MVKVFVVVAGSLEIFAVDIAPGDSLEAMKKKIRVAVGFPEGSRLQVHGAPDNDGSWVYWLRDNLVPLMRGDPAIVNRFTNRQTRLRMRHECMASRVNDFLHGMVQLVVVTKQKPDPTLPKAAPSCEHDASPAVNHWKKANGAFRTRYYWERAGDADCLCVCLLL
jgi:hypothetical protein